MRKLIVTTFLTLDGVMQAPGGPEEDDSGGFAHGGWSVNYWDDMMGEAKTEEMSGPFDLLLGRRTYEIFAAYWPNAPEEAGGKRFNDATKYVCSRSRPSLDWTPAMLMEGDAAEGVAALKEEDDGPELQVHGSGNLAQTLIRHGLVDEYRLWVFPLVLGQGKRLFADGTIPAALRLVDSKISTTGVFMGTYEPAGQVVTRLLLAHPDPTEQDPPLRMDLDVPHTGRERVRSDGVREGCPHCLLDELVLDLHPRGVRRRGIGHLELLRLPDPGVEAVAAEARYVRAGPAPEVRLDEVARTQVVRRPSAQVHVGEGRP